MLGARRAWTGAAFQEHRTGVACCATLRALIEARAPLDLIALASRFPLDEMVHVELCARMAMELGGGTEILHDPLDVIADATPDRSPLMRAAELVVRFFCVGEALSIPLLRGTWHAARHPLPRAVLGRIVRDEAAHGTFGFTFLDWALPLLDAGRARRWSAGRRSRDRRGALRCGRTSRAGRRARRREGDALAWHGDRRLPRARRALDGREGAAAAARARHLPRIPGWCPARDTRAVSGSTPPSVAELLGCDRQRQLASRCVLAGGGPAAPGRTEYVAA